MLWFRIVLSVCYCTLSTDGSLSLTHTPTSLSCWSPQVKVQISCSLVTELRSVKLNARFFLRLTPSNTTPELNLIKTHNTLRTLQARRWNSLPIRIYWSTLNAVSLRRFKHVNILKYKEERSHVFSRTVLNRTFQYSRLRAHPHRAALTLIGHSSPLIRL